MVFWNLFLLARSVGRGHFVGLLVGFFVVVLFVGLYSFGFCVVLCIVVVAFLDCGFV